MIADNYTVYVHTSPSGKRYVGITKQNPKKRWKNGEGYKAHHPYFYSAIKKYGWENFSHEIVADGLSKQEAEAKEIELIAAYNSNCREYGYNIENGGNSVGKHSEETRRKISQKLKGHSVSTEAREKLRIANLGKKGTPLTTEHRELLKRVNTGRVVSEETRLRLSRSHKGIKLSEHTKKIMSDQRKGKRHPSLWKPIVQLDSNGNVIGRFQSVIDASKSTGICDPNISAVLNSKRKTAGGYGWKHIEEGDKNNSRQG